MTSVDRVILVVTLLVAIVAVLATIVVLARRRWAPVEAYLVASDTGVVPPTVLLDTEHGLTGRPDYLVCQYDVTTRR
jgi:hypothetical protein